MDFMARILLISPFSNSLAVSPVLCGGYWSNRASRDVSSNWCLTTFTRSNWQSHIDSNLISILRNMCWLSMKHSVMTTYFLQSYVNQLRSSCATSSSFSIWPCTSSLPVVQYRGNNLSCLIKVVFRLYQPAFVSRTVGNITLKLYYMTWCLAPSWCCHGFLRGVRLHR